MGARDFDLRPDPERERRRLFRRRLLIWSLASLGGLVVLAVAVLGLLVATGVIFAYQPGRSYTSTEPPPPTIDDQGRTVTAVGWRIAPQPRFPGRAARKGLSGGAATLSCEVTLEGRAANCSVVAESPADAGFGEAALESMEEARMRPATVDGVAIPGRARFTVRFRLGSRRIAARSGAGLIPKVEALPRLDTSNAGR